MSFSGTYKGCQFRSLLELSVIKELESSGLELGSTMLYEHTRITYGKTKVRTYVVDLTIPSLKLLVEVKPESKVNNRTNSMKRSAAERWCTANGWRYTMVTDSDLKTVKAKIFTVVEASALEDVQLGAKGLRTVRRFKRREQRKLRRKANGSKGC